MTTQTHTPGPWQVGYDDGSGAGEGDGTFTIVGPDWTVVRSGESFGALYGIEREADANLIAAAPDLLAALEEIRDRSASPNVDWEEIAKDVNTAAVYAIARAKGGE